MDQILGQVLRDAVWERLDMLCDLADRADAPSLVSVARSELPRLAEGWRVMLRAHEPDERGDCPTCSTRWHRCKAPCAVWQVAHDHLVAGGLAHTRPRAATAPTSPVPPRVPEQPRGKRGAAPSTPRHTLAGGQRR
ncbi:hypothetical protein [Saccharomonospora saliphila]|uniref:hypothetical protein n=1 Tax=Saccharomonospora saliphila TaxID=369829 RepID=UPI00037DE16A|nr:hypothetical protein [Saccharomonospora saliphila]